MHGLQACIFKYITVTLDDAGRNKIYSQERSPWRTGVRSALCAASQIPGKGPTDVDDALAPAR